MTNALYYGDNLDMLRRGSIRRIVDLIYLDPPFNSNASYNVLFKAPAGEDSQRKSKRSRILGTGIISRARVR